MDFSVLSGTNDGNSSSKLPYTTTLQAGSTLRNTSSAKRKRGPWKYEENYNLITREVIEFKTIHNKKKNTITRKCPFGCKVPMSDAKKAKKHMYRHYREFECKHCNERFSGYSMPTKNNCKKH